MDRVNGSATADLAPIRRRAVMLSRWQRLSATVVGIGLSGAGSVAVFETSNQAGSTALLLIGGVALLMGITGRVPDKIGKEGLNYEAVDPATRAVENVLKDDSVPIDTREAIASAVREELDRRQESVTNPQVQFANRSELSVQANAVLFEADVMRAVRAAFPPEAFLFVNVHTIDQEFDGVIQRGSAARPISERLILEVTASRNLREKCRRDLDRLANLRPGGLIYIATRRDVDFELKFGKWFSGYTSFVGLQNAHLVFVSDEPASLSRLVEIVQRAWSALES